MKKHTFVSKELAVDRSETVDKTSYARCDERSLKCVSSVLSQRIDDERREAVQVGRRPELGTPAVDASGSRAIKTPIQYSNPAVASFPPSSHTTTFFMNARYIFDGK